MLGFNLLCLRRRRSRTRAWSPPRPRPNSVLHTTPPPPPPPPPRARAASELSRKPLRCMTGRAMAPVPPLPVTEDTPPDMLAGSMDLRVVLPSGQAVKMSVERCTPMMDLLVQVTTANKMATGGYVLQPVGDRGVLPYKPSTPIGALDTWTVQIVPKSRILSTNSLKKAPLKPNNQQPFEQTFRLQVHLPRNQLFVARVSPKTLLSDVLSLACTEKNLDPNKYELRHPANLEERLRLEWTLADYKLQEVTLIAKGNRPLGAGLSSSDIMALQKEEEKRRQQVRANGTASSAVLGLMLSKHSQSSTCDGSISSDSLGGRSISPARSDETPSPPGSSLPPPRPTRKRRPAPKPPIQTPQHAPPTGAIISHSRNSSDSSGYHEASILSESPESNGLSSPSGTLPRRSKLPSATSSSVTSSVPSHSLSRSLSNLTHMSNGDSKCVPATDGMRKNGHSISTTSLASSGHSKKKKAAPPPPPIIAKSVVPGQLKAEQRTASLSTLSSQSSVDSYEREASLRSSSLERPCSSQSSTVSSIMKHETLPEEVILQDEIQNRHTYNHGISAQSSIDTVSSSGTYGMHDNVCDGKTISGTSAVPVQENISAQESQKQTEKTELPDQSSEANLVKSIEMRHSSVPVPLSPKIEIRTNHNIKKEVSIPNKEADPCKIALETPVSLQSKDLVNNSHKTVVSSSRTSLPDVVSAEMPPTPKPRTVHRNKPPVPSPRPAVRKTNEQTTKPFLVRHTSDDDNNSAIKSEDKPEPMKRSSSLGGTFGVGKTMVILAASSQGSTSSGSIKDYNEVNSHIDSDVETITRFGTDIDDDDDEDADGGLNIKEDDLEMFEVQSNSIESSPVERTPPDTVSALDNISVASSVFDSEHETSDGTWGKNSMNSVGFRKQPLASRRSLHQVSNKEPVKMRASSLRSMEEVPAFLEGGCQLGRWSSTEDLHAGGSTDQETDLQKERDEMEKAFETVANELQAAILADEAKKASAHEEQQPVPKPASPSPSLTDWEYQLPAPPSAFRDTNSPTFTQNETVELAEVPVFEEPTPQVLPPAEFIDAEKPTYHEESTDIPYNIQISKELDPIRRYSCGITKVNPLYNDEQYEADLIAESQKSSKESTSSRSKSTGGSSVNGEGMDDEDWNPQQLTDNIHSAQSKTSSNLSRGSSFSSESNHSSQLKNFTISSYQRPCDTDIIFRSEQENKKEDVEFKKPQQTSLYNRHRGSMSSLASNLPRTNSFNACNGQSTEYPSVKRSTSHVSLSHSGRNFRTKSIGNLTVPTASENTNSGKINGVHDGDDGLRKTTSEANINQGSERSSRYAELHDQFLQWQEQWLRQTQPDIPLQSLQVLRNILSPSHETIRDKAKEKDDEDNSSDKSNSLPRQVKNDETYDTSDISSKPSSVTLRRQSSSATETNNTNKRYSYQGPPAVNFSTWSERPKSQVSIKVDSDYRIGKGQNSTAGISKESQFVSEKPFDPKEKSERTDTSSSTESSNISSQTKTNGHEKSEPAKVEPTALTMRIISHTTPVGYKRTPSFSSQKINFTSKTDESINDKEPVTRGSSYNSAKVADPSRVPIVRAVELKKSVVQGIQSSSPEKKPVTSGVRMSWNETNNQNEKNNESNEDPPEVFQGVNNLAKRFSLAASTSENIRIQRPRSVPSYLCNGSTDTVDSKDVKKSNMNMNNAKEVSSIGAVRSANQGNTKKYTSVVGINGAGISTSTEPPVDITRHQQKVSNSSTKVNGISTTRQPMPVVKGFRYATSDYSDASLVAADSHKSSQNSQPVTVKIQPHNSIQSQRNPAYNEPTSSISVRIQHTPATKISQPTSKSDQQSTPVPPPAPTLPKKTMPSRPKSFPAPEVNARDELMDAIRSFGGRGNLRQTGGS